MWITNLYAGWRVIFLAVSTKRRVLLVMVGRVEALARLFQIFGKM
jgi:hypothetical protein